MYPTGKMSMVPLGFGWMTSLGLSFKNIFQSNFRILHHPPLRFLGRWNW